MKPAAGPLYTSKVCTEGLENKAESEVNVMRTLIIITRFHVEPMNNINVTIKIYIT